MIAYRVAYIVAYILPPTTFIRKALYWRKAATIGLLGLTASDTLHKSISTQKKTGVIT